MSLQAIRELRMQRQKPTSIVDVIVGKAPTFCKGRPDLIELPTGSQPALMDWRPVVGLWVAFYLVEEDWVVMDAAVQAAHDAGAKLFGFACREDAFPLCTFADPETEKRAERSLRGYLEFLCTR